MGNFSPYTPSPSRHMEPCLILTPVTTSVTLFQISPQCPTSRCSSPLAAAALSEPPSVTELPSVGGGVQYQLYSCTVVQCTHAGHRSHSVWARASLRQHSHHRANCKILLYKLKKYFLHLQKRLCTGASGLVLDLGYVCQAIVSMQVNCH